MAISLRSPAGRHRLRIKTIGPNVGSTLTPSAEFMTAPHHFRDDYLGSVTPELGQLLETEPRSFFDRLRVPQSDVNAGAQSCVALLRAPFHNDIAAQEFTRSDRLFDASAEFESSCLNSRGRQ